MCVEQRWESGQHSDHQPLGEVTHRELVVTLQGGEESGAQLFPCSLGREGGREVREVREGGEGGKEVREGGREGGEGGREVREGGR